MDTVARLAPSARSELFSQAAVRMHLLPGLVEKDFWVCWTLKHLFDIPEVGRHLMFKGGTTLSKVFGAIERFSEDIDLAVDWAMLGFAGDRDPTRQMSNTRRTKLLDQMLTACRQYIANDFLGSVQARFEDRLGSEAGFSLAVSPGDGHIVEFQYPRTTEGVEYVRPVVMLELGTHAEFVPNDEYEIRPYAWEHFPDVFSDPECRVWAIRAERTFWEKATILHQEAFRTADHPAPLRYARHYYDVAMLAANDTIRSAALDSRDLLDRVVAHKRSFYPRAWARYDLAVPETLRLLPSDAWSDYLRRDYEQMQVLFFGQSPAFDQVMSDLTNLEQAIRQM